MAIFPCDQHGGRYTGPQRTAYPAVVSGSLSMRERRRLCLSCFSDVLQFCEARMLPAESEVEPAACMACDEPLDSLGVFVTLYPGRDERHDFYGRTCSKCLGDGVGLVLFGRQASFDDALAVARPAAPDVRPAPLGAISRWVEAASSPR